MEREVKFNKRMASVCGIREAVIATFLWYLLEDSDPDNCLERYGDCWVRITHKMITAEFPFMTEYMVQGSIRKLVEAGIIKIRDLNEDRFDHTNWYAFTDYGDELML